MIDSSTQALVDTAFAFAETRHVLQVGKTGWGLQHPLRCRPALAECALHKQISGQSMQWFPVDGDYLLDDSGNILGLNLLPDPAVAFLAALEAYKAAHSQ